MDPEIIAALFQMRRLAYALTDRTLRIVRIHDPGCLLTAHDAAAPAASLFDLAPELVGSEDVLAELLAGRLERHRLEMINRGGETEETRYLQLLLLPRRLGASEPLGLLLLVGDMTELGQMQQQLMQSRNELLLTRHELASRNLELAAANLELRKLADMKSAFVSVAAHELRTPLAIIRGYADMLLDGMLGGLAQPQREGLEILRHSSERLLGIVNNLLDVSRLEAGRVDLLMQPLDLGVLAAKAAREFQPVFAAASQQLAVTVQPDLPAVLCDETRTFQVLTNLLSNAARYTPNGGRVELGVRVAERSGEALVTVRDTGVGIPLEDQKRLGSLFFRASNANSASAQGTGLGLYITSSLVQMHGGRLWFESVEGQGSTFYVTFLLAGTLESD